MATNILAFVSTYTTVRRTQLSQWRNGFLAAFEIRAFGTLHDEGLAPFYSDTDIARDCANSTWFKAGFEYGMDCPLAVTMPTGLKGDAEEAVDPYRKAAITAVGIITGVIAVAWLTHTFLGA